MKEHPILFNTAMVRAILEGRKTQTRRPIELGPYSPDYYAMYKLRYKVGDILWVRETWMGVYSLILDQPIFLYRATNPDYPNPSWCPSIHMPRKACRLFLEVDDVGIHRLQDISENEAKAEGMESVTAFHSTWNSLYRALQYQWEANPWVWAIKFHALKRN